MKVRTFYLILGVACLFINRNGFCSDFLCRRVHNPIQERSDYSYLDNSDINDWSPELVDRAVEVALSEGSEVERVIDILSRIGKATYSVLPHYELAYAAMNGLTEIGEKLPQYRQATINALESFKKTRGPAASRIKWVANTVLLVGGRMWVPGGSELWIYNRAVYSQEYLQLCDKKDRGVISDEDFERQSSMLKIEHVEAHSSMIGNIDLHPELTSAVGNLLNSLQVDSVYSTLLVSAVNMIGWSPNSVDRAVELALSEGSETERAIDVLSELGKAKYSVPSHYELAYAVMNGLTEIGEKLPQYRQATINALESFKKTRGPAASSIIGIAAAFRGIVDSDSSNRANMLLYERADVQVYEKAKEHQDYLMSLIGE